MTSGSRWKLINELFTRALLISEEEQAGFLARECEDEGVRAVVLDLLQEDRRANDEGFLRPPDSSDFHPAFDGLGPIEAANRGLHILCPNCRQAIEIVGVPAQGYFTCRVCQTTFKVNEAVVPEVKEDSTQVDEDATQVDEEATRVDEEVSRVDEDATRKDDDVVSVDEEATEADGRPAAAYQSEASRRKLGRFEIVNWIGEGGFGTVYKARDPRLDVLVALKVPRLGNLCTGRERHRFVEEARSTARLRHPSIVRVHEVGEADGVPYIVSDLIEGMTLAELMSDSAAPMPGREAARIAADLADALQHAHENLVIHRDVKPSNVMIDRLGQVMLMDFGLARRVVAELTMTADGQVLGTPAYMSPEQARGEGQNADARTDIYGLGAVLYHMIAGSRPFQGTERMIVQRVVHDEPRPPRALNDMIPRDLENICLKAMSKEPSKRYPTATEIADDLRRFLDGRPVAARPVGRAERLRRWCVRNPRPAAAVATIALLLVGVAATSTALAVVSQRQVIDSYRRLATDDFQLALNEFDRGEVGPGILASNAPATTRGSPANRNSSTSLRTTLRPGVASTRGSCPSSRTTTYCPSRSSALTAIPSSPGTTKVSRNSGTPPIPPPPPCCCIRAPPSCSRLSAGTGRFLLTADTNGSVRRWDARNGAPLGSELKHDRPVRYAAFADGDQTLTTLDEGGTARRWDAAGTTIGEPLALGEAVYTARFSPDGRSLLAAATVGGQVSLRLWDLNTRVAVPLAHPDQANVRLAVFRDDGKVVATGSDDGIVRFWDVATAGLLGQTTSIGKSIESLAFRPDGQRLAIATGGPFVALCDAATFIELDRFPIEGGHASKVAFGRDGTKLLAICSDKSVRLWDVATRKPIGRPFRHLTYIHSAALSPDGRSLLTCGSDSAAKLWEVGAVGLDAHAIPVSGLGHGRGPESGRPLRPRGDR